ncbi:MAG: hypothetical protein ACREPR_21910 [Brasilonema sp.]
MSFFVQERINTYDTAHKISAVAKMPTDIVLILNKNRLECFLCNGEKLPANLVISH